jgi:hypothetical protein
MAVKKQETKLTVTKVSDRRHAFNPDGVCVKCGVRWDKAVGTVCNNERTQR